MSRVLSLHVFDKIMKFRIIIICLSLVGCTKTTNPEQKVGTALVQDDEQFTITHSIAEVLDPKAKSMVASWDEYQKVEELVSEFYNISPDQALQKSRELAEATQALRDSVRVDRFLQPDLQMRLNVINNIALRINDMSSISQIEPQEISDEVGNLMQLFSSINRRLNNITRQQALEEELQPINNESVKIIN